MYKQLAAAKASKIWFSYSHNCTLANEAISYSVCQIWLCSGLPEGCKTRIGLHPKRCQHANFYSYKLQWAHGSLYSFIESKFKDFSRKIFQGLKISEVGKAIFCWVHIAIIHCFQLYILYNCKQGSKHLWGCGGWLSTNVACLEFKSLKSSWISKLYIAQNCLKINLEMYFSYLLIQQYEWKSQSTSSQIQGLFNTVWTLAYLDQCYRVGSLEYFGPSFT